MLEIIFIIFLTKKLASMAKAKGRSAGWAAFGPVLWIVGEITGAAVGAMIGMDELALYGGALVGAFIGAGIAFAIVSSLSATENAYMAEQPFVGGHYDPTNPYNAPGTNPYQAAPPPNDGNSPFNR